MFIVRKSRLSGVGVSWHFIFDRILRSSGLKVKFPNVIYGYSMIECHCQAMCANGHSNRLKRNASKHLAPVTNGSYAKPILRFPNFKRSNLHIVSTMARIQFNLCPTWTTMQTEKLSRISPEFVWMNGYDLFCAIDECRGRIYKLCIRLGPTLGAFIFLSS